MKQKTETPHRGQTVQGGKVVNISDFRGKNINTNPLHFENHIGWPRSCIECGASFTLSYVAGAARDGRQELCPRCVFDGLRQRRWRAR